MRVAWDQIGERRYKTGVDHGVLYQLSGKDFINGVAWNGLTGVDPKSTGRDKTPLYSNDVVKKLLFTPETYAGSINCYTYPDELEACLGNTTAFPGIYIGQQDRSMFGFSYRTLIGDDAQGDEAGYRITMIYNAFITDISDSNKTVGQDTNVTELNLSFETVPMELSDDYDPCSTIIVDSTYFSPDSMEMLENILYGTENSEPRLPTFEEIMEFYANYYMLIDDMSMFDGYPSPTLFPHPTHYPKTVGG